MRISVFPVGGSVLSGKYLPATFFPGTFYGGIGFNMFHNSLATYNYRAGDTVTKDEIDRNTRLQYDDFGLGVVINAGLEYRIFYIKAGMMMSYSYKRGFINSDTYNSADVILYVGGVIID